MRLILPLLLFTVICGAAWGQCTNTNGTLNDITKCPGPVYYNGPVTINPANLPQSNVGSPYLAATAVTSNASGALGSLPANAHANSAFFHETANHTVTLSIGTTSGGSDVASNLVVPANGTLTYVPFQAPNWFSASAPQALFLSSASWGGASINCQLVYQVGP